MQKIICTIICCCFLSYCFCQDGENKTASVSKQDYLKKSNNQKRTAGILFGVGSTAFIIASTGNISFDVVAPLVIGAAVAVLSSIPFFIASGKNKKRALNASAGIEIQQLQIPSFVISKPFTALSVKIHF